MRRIWGTVIVVLLSAVSANCSSSRGRPVLPAPRLDVEPQATDQALDAAPFTEPVEAAAAAGALRRQASPVGAWSTDDDQVWQVDLHDAAFLGGAIGGTYQFTVDFTAECEQTIWIYRVGESPEDGLPMLHRHAMLNNLWQGMHGSATVVLDPGEQYVVVGWHKLEMPPTINDLPWFQSRLAEDGLAAGGNGAALRLLFRADRGGAVVTLEPATK